MFTKKLFQILVIKRTFSTLERFAIFGLMGVSVIFKTSVLYIFARLSTLQRTRKWCLFLQEMQ